MLQPLTYEFPTESDVFVRQAYTDRAKAINAAAAAEDRKNLLWSILLGLGLFLSIFALGAGGAAVVDRGWENIKNTRIANVEP